MHVLIIPSWYPTSPDDVGGSFFREQAQALAVAGCKVGVIYPQPRTLRSWPTVLLGKYGLEVGDDSGIPTYRFHYVQWLPRMRGLQAWQWLRHGANLYVEYVKEHGKPNIIHAHSLLHAGCLARELMTRYGTPYVVTEHSSAFARGLVPDKQRLLALDAARKARRVFAVSAEFCKFLDEYFNNTTPLWRPLPNIVNDSFLSVPILNHTEANEFFLLHISLLDANKSVDNLIRAYAEAFELEDGVTLKIGGNGPCRLQLEALANKLGVARRVWFLGALSRVEVLEQMLACDAFVLSSRHETFGLALTEALAVGKPVITTRCGGPESIVREQDGLLVPVDDVAGLARAMRQIRDNYDRYNPAEIRASCAARFSEQVVTAKLISEYEAVCNDVGLRAG